MADSFFERPILNSPYEYPGRHWELDAERQPTNHVIEQRRRADFISPIPRPHAHQGAARFVQPDRLDDARALHDVED